MPTAEDGAQVRWLGRGERVVHDSRFLTVSVADVELPGGETVEHHFVRAPGAAIIVVQDERQRILMMYRHRFVSDLWGWELPGGLVDDREDPAVTAAREAEEETGYRPRNVRHLLTYQPMAGMVDSPHHIYLADGADLVGGPTECTEAQETRWMPLDEAAELLRSGRTVTSGTAIGLLAVLGLGGARQQPGGAQEQPGGAQQQGMNESHSGRTVRG